MAFEKQSFRSRPVADVRSIQQSAWVDIERDAYGVPVNPAERMQQVMLGLYDLIDEAGQADFPEDLIGELDLVRRRFMDNFEDRYPGYGEGRAICC